MQQRDPKTVYQPKQEAVTKGGHPYLTKIAKGKKR